ncbi:integrase-recombinase protein (plasmid) [Calothrix brevissima NIES-22]|nr:integrase-recombinase protein [Calothrix brevissima NIES-22]
MGDSTDLETVRRLVGSEKVGECDRTLSIKGKGKGMQITKIDLAPTTVQAVSEWLEARGHYLATSPLFTALDPAHYGHRLSGESLRRMVDQSSQQAGISKKMSPHRVRHSAITAALDATDGNIRKVQKLSRHADPRTLMIYDDNRARDQEELSGLLANMV